MNSRNGIHSQLAVVPFLGLNSGMANPKNLNSFKTQQSLQASGKTFAFHSLKEFEKNSGRSLAKLPFSLKILLENLLRGEEGIAVKKADIEAIAQWNPKAEPDYEIQFMPARVLLQDFTGVPAVADLAAMRAAIQKMGGDANRINPLSPADLVIDHSVQVDFAGTPTSFQQNADLEFDRNRERYEFLRWGQTSFKNFRVVPPDTGIVHQINLEYLAHVAMTGERDSQSWVYPDTLVGTDSHTTMINGLGCLGWGVGGIEAEAALLGQPCSMLIPQVVGFRLVGKLPVTTTATDLVLTVTQMLRKKGVVGKFVEFFGNGLANLSLADRATIANMAPEYGATCGIFPVDQVTIDFMKLTGRSEKCELIEKYFKAQGMWFEAGQAEAEYSDVLELDLSTVEPCLAGPARPQDRVPLREVRKSFRKGLAALLPKAAAAMDKAVLEQWSQEAAVAGAATAGLVPETASNHPDQKFGHFGKGTPVAGAKYQLTHGSVVIAAITSCTNTSNPSVLMAAGLLAKNAVARGMKVKPWVKTSLAPGSKVVTDYLKQAGLMQHLEALNFHLVGYGCTTCIGNSGPLADAIEGAIKDGDLCVASVLSGNRNFEGRVHALVRANYLGSPPLVVAYALAGNVNIDLTKEPVGVDSSGKPVMLTDIWPTPEQVASEVAKHVTSEQFKSSYADVFKGDKNWQNLQVPTGNLYKWDSESTYIKEPPFFADMKKTPDPVQDIVGARVLAFLGDSVTTDHISPAGGFKKDHPAGQYLVGLGVNPKDFNGYGARRGNHEVMVRGTFANVRLKNFLVPGVEGGVTMHLPTNKQMSIFDASMQYQADKTALIVIAGKEYGTGSSRDWAAKGPKLLGIRAVIAESFERIHRSNLVGMGILPMQFKAGESATSLGLTGHETFEIKGVNSVAPGQMIEVQAKAADGTIKKFQVKSRIDTLNEVEYFKNGGILQYVLRQAIG
jgi:aconitate hydratase